MSQLSTIKSLLEKLLSGDWSVGVWKGSLHARGPERHFGNPFVSSTYFQGPSENVSNHVYHPTAFHIYLDVMPFRFFICRDDQAMKARYCLFTFATHEHEDRLSGRKLNRDVYDEVRRAP